MLRFHCALHPVLLTRSSHVLFRRLVFHQKCANLSFHTTMLIMLK